MKANLCKSTEQQKARATVKLRAKLQSLANKEKKQQQEQSSKKQEKGKIPKKNE